MKLRLCSLPLKNSGKDMKPTCTITMRKNFYPKQRKLQIKREKYYKLCQLKSSSTITNEMFCENFHVLLPGEKQELPNMVYFSLCVWGGGAFHLFLVLASFICQRHINFIYLDIYFPPFAIRTLNPKRENRKCLIFHLLCLFYFLLYYIIS